MYLLTCFRAMVRKHAHVCMFSRHGARTCICIHVFAPWCQNMHMFACFRATVREHAHVCMFSRHGARTCICLHVVDPWCENMHMSACFGAMVREHVFVYMFFTPWCEKLLHFNVSFFKKINILYLKNAILALKKRSYIAYLCENMHQSKKLHVFALLRENMCFIFFIKINKLHVLAVLFSAKTLPRK